MPTNPLEDMRQQFVKSQDEAGTGTLAGLSNLLKGAQNPLKSDSGTTRIPLSILPPDAKVGDRISLTVTGIDSINKTATMVADQPENAVPEAPAQNEVIDTGKTLGPIDDLKSYLFKKTQEQE